MKSIETTFPGITKESFSEFEERYEGFGKEVYKEIEKQNPELFSTLSFYKWAEQPTDSIVMGGSGYLIFGIQLDPLTPAIVLWNDEKHFEVGNWSEEPILEVLDLLQKTFAKRGNEID